MPVPKFKLGEQVILVDKSKFGTLKYLGRTHFKEGIWAGLEVAEQFEGKHDGMVDGTRYFSCPEGKGMFVSAENIRAFQTKSSPTQHLQSSTSKISVVPDDLDDKVLVQSLKVGLFASILTPRLQIGPF
jgi:dynactin complex subunit